MKKVFVTQRVEIIKQYNEIRDCLDQKWIDLLLECNLLPIAVQNNIEQIELMLKEVNPDGILLTGGNDLCKYGGNAEERDRVEYHLIKYAINNNIPLLGVCRGMQIILDYFNCNFKKVIGHVNIEHIIKNGETEKLVNSYHNFATLECGQDIDVIYKSKDGVIEEIKHNKYEIYGIMYHPERYESFRRDDIKLIKSVFA